MPADARTRLLPAWAIAYNALVWGVSWLPLQHLQGQGLHPLWSTALMYSLPALALLLWRPQLLREFARQDDLWWLLLASGLTNACFNWAVATGDVIRVVLLFYLMPVWTVFLAWWLLDERPTRSALWRVLLALAGVVLVLQPADGHWQLPLPQNQADVLALLGGFFFSCTNVLLNRSSRHSSPQARVLAMFAGGVLLGSLTAWSMLQLGRMGVTPLPPLEWSWVLQVVLFSLLFISGNVALQYGSARLSSHTMSLIMLLEVIFASITSAWLGSAQLGLQVLAGGVLVMAAALLAIPRQASRAH